MFDARGPPGLALAAYLDVITHSRFLYFTHLMVADDIAAKPPLDFGAGFGLQKGFHATQRSPLIRAAKLGLFHLPF